MTPPGAPRVGGPVDGGAGPGDPARPDERDGTRAPALRAVGAAPDSSGAGAGAGAPAPALHGQRGLALAYAVLDRLVAEHGLARAAVVVDDPELGRQVLYDRRRSLDEGDLAVLDAARAADPSGGTGRGLVTAPPLDPVAVDAELVVTLVEAALSVALLDATAAPSDPADVLELSIRRIPGVGAVAVDRDAGVVQVAAGAPAPDSSVDAPGGAAPTDLAARVVDLATSFLEGTVAVEILRGGPAAGHGAGAVFGAAPATGTELVAVTSALDTLETEVHLRRRDVRTIGRAPAAHGLAGGVEAAIDALRGLGVPVAAELEWARTIETTSQRRFVVGVALRDEHGVSRYGLAEGGTPVAAAAQAALDALLT